MKEQKKYFLNSDDLRLCGVLTKPDRGTKNCIMLCHGITVDKDEDGIFTALASKLSKAGFAVFRFDFRGHGESAGNSVEMTVSGEERDIEAAAEFLQSLGYLKFGILGASFAGGAVSLFAEKHQNIVKVLVLWNAIIDYRSMLKPELPWQKRNFGDDAMLRLKAKGYTKIGSRNFSIGKELFDEIKTLKPWKALQSLRVPVLFVHGDKDTYVPYGDSVKYSKILKSARLVTIHNAEHGFHARKKDSEIADKATLDFFKKHLS